MKITQALLLAFLLASVWSCQKDQEITKQEIETQTEPEYPYSPCGIQHVYDPNEVSSRHRYSASNQTIQTPCDTIWIDVDDESCDLPINWIGALNQAILRYNALPTPITFAILTGKGDSDILVRCTEFSQECQAGATLPSGGVGYISIDLNEDLPSGDCFCPDQEAAPLTLCRLSAIVMHELGHALGLGHNDNTSLDTIAGTPLVDEFSVFNSYNIPNAFCANICTFSAADIEALKILYPCSDCPVDYSIDGPELICEGGTAEYCISEELDVEWTAPSSIAGATGNCITISAGQLEEEGIAATITVEGGCSYPLTKSIALEPNEPCEIPNSPPSVFDNICFSVDPVCYDFSGFECLKDLVVTSSYSKLLVEVENNVVCLSSIHPRKEEVQLTVTPIGHCQNGETKIWNITVNDPDHCEGGGLGGPF